jgi:hypothetical protein
MFYKFLLKGCTNNTSFLEDMITIYIPITLHKANKAETPALNSGEMLLFSTPHILNLAFKS